MQGFKQINFDVVKAQAPAGMLEGLAPSKRRRGASDLITSRKNAGRSMRTGVFFGGAKRPCMSGRARVCGIH